MIRHVVLYSYQADVSDEVINKIYQDLDEISARLPGRLSYTWGKYYGYENRNKGYTHCLVTDFADDAARSAFIDDKVRVAFSNKEVLPRMVGGLDGLVSFDFIWDKPL